MGFKTILVDDEPLALNRLRRLIEPHRAVIEIVAEAVDGDQALELIDELQPDLVFLDIQMPGLSGFEVLSRLSHLPLRPLLGKSSGIGHFPFPYVLTFHSCFSTSISVRLG